MNKEQSPIWLKTYEQALCIDERFHPHYYSLQPLSKHPFFLDLILLYQLTHTVSRSRSSEKLVVPPKNLIEFDLRWRTKWIREYLFDQTLQALNMIPPETNAKPLTPLRERRKSNLGLPKKTLLHLLKKLCQQL